MFPKRIAFLALSMALFLSLLAKPVSAQTARVTPSPASSASPEASVSASPTSIAISTPAPRTDLTQKSEESVGPLEQIISSQLLGELGPTNFMQYAIRNAVSAGVPANTIVLLLLLPLIATIIALARHLVGLRGFGIFLPAALSVVFLAIGPVVGIALFLIIVAVSTITRLFIRKFKIKLQYLPRMAMILWVVVLAVLGVLFTAPIIQSPGIVNVSIFPVLILVLLSEDFTKVQLGKSINTAINLTTETLILSLVSYIFLTLQPIQSFALLNPEMLLLGIFIANLLIGKYVGLRFLEYWRFRKLINA